MLASVLQTLVKTATKLARWPFRRFLRISINKNRSVVSGRGALLGLRRPLDRSLMMSEERWRADADGAEGPRL